LSFNGAIEANLQLMIATSFLRHLESRLVAKGKAGILGLA
jgi:hypothetical protein